MKRSSMMAITRINPCTGGFWGTTATAFRRIHPRSASLSTLSSASSVITGNTPSPALSTRQPILSPCQISLFMGQQQPQVFTSSANTRHFTSMSTNAMMYARYERNSRSCNNFTARSFWRKAFKPQKPPPPPSKFNYKIDFDHTLKSLQGIHQYVKNNLSLDLWTINLLLLGFVAGPSIYNAMKNSRHTEDDYMFSVPVDDPVEHSVRILMELNDKSLSSSADEEKSLLKSTFNNPEDDARRILSDLLDSEHLRTTASRIASSVIQSPPFQNACKVLVRNIWNDLVNDPETNNQLVALVQSVLQNERVYAAVKEMMIQLVNDEEVYKELTKLVVQLGEEKEVQDATQRLLTESTHKTLNDPSVLDHSMEFTTEVLGDDVVQRSGGEALRNTLGYAVQPSGSAIFAGLGTMLVAGLLHFYFFRGRGNYIDEGWLSPRSSFDSLSASDAVRNKSFDIGGGNVLSTLFQSTRGVISNIVSFPVLLVGSIYNAITNAFSYPRQAFSYGSEKIQSGIKYIAAVPSNLWSKLLSFSSWIGATAKSLASSACAYASARIYDLQSGFRTMGHSCMNNIRSTSKTTKGAMLYIVKSIHASVEQGFALLTQLLSSIRSRWAASGSDT